MPQARTWMRRSLGPGSGRGTSIRSSRLYSDNKRAFINGCLGGVIPQSLRGGVNFQIPGHVYDIRLGRRGATSVMSYLDNLENNLKALESRDERTTASRKRPEQDRKQANASQPYAEKLRNSEFTKNLLD